VKAAPGVAAARGLAKKSCVEKSADPNVLSRFETRTVRKVPEKKVSTNPQTPGPAQLVKNRDCALATDGRLVVATSVVPAMADRSRRRSMGSALQEFKYDYSKVLEAGQCASVGLLPQL